MQKYLLSLSFNNKISPKTLAILYKNNLLNKNNFKKTILVNNGITLKQVEQVLLAIKLNSYEDCLQKLKKQKVQFITIESKHYPEILKEIFFPPLVLFYLGDINLLSKTKKISIVGSRKASIYGKKVLETLVESVKGQDLVVVSGLALGIDGVAHRLALANNLKTIAVLGNGLPNIYPVSHARLAQNIILNKGLIISEFPPGSPPLPQNFPQRNRIVAGLSPYLLVAEANERSGSLITARIALEENREVATIAFSFFSSSGKGCMMLLKNGARLITSINDFLEMLQIEEEEYRDEDVGGQEGLILKYLSKTPLTIDQIVVKSKIDVKVVSSIITTLELKGLIVHLGNKGYLKK